MILNTTTRKIQILLASAVTTNQCPIVVDYVDFTSTTTTAGNQLSNTNSTTAVDIVSAPAASTQRKINLITVCNKDSVNIVITIRINDNGTTYNYLSSLSLPTGATLQFTDTNGWSVISSNGGVVQQVVGSIVDIQTYASNNTWIKPTSATYTFVDVFGAGQSGGSARSQTNEMMAGAPGGAGGSRKQFLFLAADLSSTVSVTVGAPSASAVTAGSSSFGTYITAAGGGGTEGGSAFNGRGHTHAQSDGGSGGAGYSPGYPGTDGDCYNPGSPGAYAVGAQGGTGSIFAAGGGGGGGGRSYYGGTGSGAAGGGAGPLTSGGGPGNSGTAGTPGNSLKAGAGGGGGNQSYTAPSNATFTGGAGGWPGGGGGGGYLGASVGSTTYGGGPGAGGCVQVISW